MTHQLPDLSHLEGINEFLIIGEDGLPNGSLNLEQIQNDGCNLAFTLAAHCGNEDKTAETIRQAIQQHGNDGITYVLINAIRLLTDDILGPAFDVMQAATQADPRAKMAEIGGIKE